MNPLEYKCRACRIETKSCLEMNRPFGNASTLTIIECMNLCTGVPASQSDGLPNHICTNCNDELRTTYNFIQKVRDSDEFFLKEFKLTVISDPLFVDQSDEIPTDINVGTKVEPKDNSHTDDECFGAKFNVPSSPWGANLPGKFDESDDDNNLNSNWADNDGGFSDSSDDKPLQIILESASPKEKTKLSTKKRARETAPCEGTTKDKVPPKRNRKPIKEAKNINVDKDTPLVKQLNNKPLDEDEFNEPNITTDLKQRNVIIKANTEILPPKRVESPDGDFLEFQFRCKICGKIANDKNRLGTHIKYVHMKIRDFLCTLCPKMFFTQKVLDEHMNAHNNLRPIKCKECGKGFTSKMILNFHKRVHSDERPFVCSVCGKSFRHKASLHGHMFIHTRKGHECKECGKNFARPNELQKHILGHTGEKPFRCEICPSISYQHSSTLTYHMKTHNYNDAKCVVCHEELYSFDDWKAHKNMHKKKPWDP